MYKIVHIVYLENILAKNKGGSVCIPPSQKLPWDLQCSEKAEEALEDAHWIKGQLAVLKDETKSVNINFRSDFCLWTEHRALGDRV